MTEDDQLMIRIQSGELRAFDELVEKYQGPLIGFFFRNTRDSQISEDLSQETLLRVYNQSWDYLPQGRFRGWMYRVARNLMIDNIRRQSHDALIKAYTGKQADEDDSLNRLASEVVSPEEKANVKELALITKRAAEVARQGLVSRSGGGVICCVRVWLDVDFAWCIRFVEMGLGNEDRPVRKPFANARQSFDDTILLAVHGAHDGDGAMARAFSDGEIIGRVVGCFADAARVEKTDQRGFRRQFVDVR